MWYVPKCLINYYLKMIGFNGNKSKVLISKLEIKSISGTLKICETLINFNNPFDFQSESSISITNIAIHKFCFKFLTLEVCIVCYAKKWCICSVVQMQVRLHISKQFLILSRLPDPQSMDFEVRSSIQHYW